MISDDDLDACFSTNEFGVEAVFDLNPGTLTITGYFTRGSDAIREYGVDIEAVEPSFTCKTSDVTSIRNGMSVEIENDTYEVKRMQKVGTGVSCLYLKT